MTKLSKEQVQRNKIILVLILCAIALVIYLMIVQSIKNYEKKMMNHKVNVQYTYQEALALQMKSGAQYSDGVQWSDATKSQMDEYLNPVKFYHHPEQKYQFLNLGMSQKVSYVKLNQLLKGKGILDGLGKSFAKASRIEDINEIYLINHALLETGKGTSTLARGVTVDDKGRVGYGEKKYYNFFGIGAYDHAPVKEAAKFAYQQGWDTPEKAVMGGAQFIKDAFIQQQNQNTLYGMRFNPAKPGKHQYATDVRWAHHNARGIAHDYKKLKLKGKYFTRYYYKQQ
ncbi:N-acetylglucosaminidase [Macrococcoides caseolyticum]|uniref:N-acetylglucosaminidase n=1 Tax=Macrococcoides caseolyticum TaxID=69966 RepID=UPI001F2485EF|nr:N-acetylglucosaminidase [Macrococcus caseolyticus]MCE4956419.1 N-acetylglucosaminidase [Macrococcus caseolyticus]